MKTLVKESGDRKLFSLSCALNFDLILILSNEKLRPNGIAFKSNLS